MVDRRYFCQLPTDCIAEPLSNMVKPAKPALAESGGDSGKTSTSQHFFVGNLILPPNSRNTTEASLVESVNFLFLHSLLDSHFGAVQ